MLSVDLAAGSDQTTKKIVKSAVHEDLLQDRYCVTALTSYDIIDQVISRQC